MNSTGALPGRLRRAWPVVWRLALLVAAVGAVNLVAGWLIEAWSGVLTPQGKMMLNATVLAVLLLYALLLAIPFVPGVEIGISLLIAHGSDAAPFVYIATLAGLSLSYLLGVAFSDRFSCRFLATLGLNRACAFVDEMKEMNREQRLQRLHDSLPDWVAGWVLRRRHLLLALMLNLPGNSLIGGGGGIALIAGLSRTFSGSGFLATIALGTLPVPLAVYFFGPGLMG